MCDTRLYMPSQFCSFYTATRPDANWFFPKFYSRGPAHGVVTLANEASNTMGRETGRSFLYLQPVPGHFDSAAGLAKSASSECIRSDCIFPQAISTCIERFRLMKILERRQFLSALSLSLSSPPLPRLNDGFVRKPKRTISHHCRLGYAQSA